MWPAPRDLWSESRIDRGEGKILEKFSWVGRGSMCPCIWFAVSYLAAGVGCDGDPISWVRVVGSRLAENLGTQVCAKRRQEVWS